MPPTEALRSAETRTPVSCEARAAPRRLNGACDVTDTALANSRLGAYIFHNETRNTTLLPISVPGARQPRAQSRRDPYHARRGGG